jgi:hypothetical protein
MKKSTLNGLNHLFLTDTCRINDPKRHENNAKLTLFNRFLPVSKTDENRKSPVFNGGICIFKLGSFGNFWCFKKGVVGHRDTETQSKDRKPGPGLK